MPSFRRGRRGTDTDPGNRALSFSELQALQQAQSAPADSSEDPTPRPEPLPQTGKGTDRWVHQAVSNAHMS